MATVKVFGPNGEIVEVEVEDIPEGSTFGPNGEIVPPPETVKAPTDDGEGAEGTD
ncbi:hypothetical protein AB0E69_26815 [Kribbella sp. NPDC026611]|uniref:hypothetical protein n=1 Tax=Kribbella sp. NPDC026611 TaxID=3154911 RepID=UPI00340C5674